MITSLDFIGRWRQPLLKERGLGTPQQLV